MVNTMWIQRDQPPPVSNARLPLFQDRLDCETVWQSFVLLLSRQFVTATRQVEYANTVSHPGRGGGGGKKKGWQNGTFFAFIYLEKECVYVLMRVSSRSSHRLTFSPSSVGLHLSIWKQNFLLNLAPTNLDSLFLCLLSAHIITGQSRHVELLGEYWGSRLRFISLCSNKYLNDWAISTGWSFAWN